MKFSELTDIQKRINQVPTGSKDEILVKLKRHYESTKLYLQMIESGEAAQGDGVIGDWFVHSLVADDDTIASYFPENLRREVKALVLAIEVNDRKRQKEVYCSVKEIQRRRIPWFKEMDLVDNLRKTLSLEQMIHFHAKATYIPPYLHDSICMEYQRVIGTHPETKKIYLLKKNLEERMIAWLESQKTS